MSDFSDSTKHLDLVPARVATRQEALDAKEPFDKFYGYQKSRDIKKLHKQIILPAYSLSSGQMININRLMFQYNVTAPRDFYILNANENYFSEHVSNSLICVKWRVGTTVYRYNVSTPRELLSLAAFSLVSYTPYNNQLVGKYCVFEVWRVTIPPLLSDMGLISDVSIKTSLLENPSDANNIVGTLSTGELQTITEMGINLPASVPRTEMLPFYQPNTVWLSN